MPSLSPNVHHVNPTPAAEYLPPQPGELRRAGAEAYRAGLELADLPDHPTLRAGWREAERGESASLAVEISFAHGGSAREADTFLAQVLS